MRLDALLLALVAVAWLPANHYYPWASAWQEGLALFMVAAGVAMLTRRAQLPWSWLLFLAVALTSVAAQLALGKLWFAGDAWIVACYLIAFGLSLIAGTTLIDEVTPREAPRLELLCLVLLAAALVSAGIGFAQWADVQRLGIFGADLKPGARPFANFGQPNHWCTASLIGFGAAWVLYEGRRIGGLAFGLAAAMLLMAMVASGSRTAWLQLGLGAAIWWWSRRRSELRLQPLALAATLLAVTVAWLVWPLLNQQADPGTVRSVSAQAEVGVRGPLWHAMWHAIAERPWGGYGWQQMVLAQQAVALELPPLLRHFEHAHNLVLDLLLWTGVPVGLLLIGLAAWGLAPLVTRSNDARSAGLLLAIGGVMAHAMVEFAVEYAYFLLPMGLMIGAAHRLCAHPAAGMSVPVAAARVCGLGLLGVLVLTGIDYAEAERNHRTLRMESARIGTDRIESAPPQLRVLTQLEAFLTYARIQPKTGASAEDIEWVRRVASRFAYPPSLYRLAQWQALNGDPVGAGRTLKVLCSMHSPDHCRDVVAGWAAAQAQQPLLQAVSLPPVPR